MASSSRNKVPMKILIAVDFGTTFSGVAYVNTRNHHERVVIQNWGNEVQGGEKVPTVLKYDESAFPSTYRWGFEVEDDEKGKREWFKLSLYDRIEENDLTRNYPIKTPDISEWESEKMVVDYLTSLRQHVEQYLKAELRAVWRTTPKEWIITVPAVWPDKSKAKTLAYAKKAGMEPSNKIQIIAEPEAAGIYALETMRNIDLNIGDTFVVCDAGGGTVDLVSYVVMSLKSPAVVEAAPGSGGLCGGSFLNRVFSEYLDKKFAGFPAWNDDYQSAALVKFEKTIKQTFAGDEKKVYLIPVMGLPDNRELGIKKRQLAISGKDIKEVFEPVIKEIVKLVNAQIQATKGKQVKAVLLAGGFGRNEYLRSRLQSEVGTEVDVRKIVNSNTSIALGALIRGLSKVAVEAGDESLPYMRLDSRIARKHYGTLSWEDFDPKNKDHQSKNSEYDPLTGKYRIQVMHWFIKKGDAVKESKPEQLRYFVRKAVDLGSLKPMPIDIYVYEDTNGSVLPTCKTPDVQLLVKLQADLGKIPPERLEQHQGQNGKLFYRANYDIEMTLHSASLSFTLVHAGHTYPAVEAEFV